jgi:hypothetical protein
MNDPQTARERKLISFRIGDVFDPDDDVALWLLTIVLAFNDIVLTHVRADEATEEWERFYFSRVAFGHYNEILLYLERVDSKPSVQKFIASLPTAVQDAYRETLAIYDGNRAVANRLRNEAIFHYPDKGGVDAMRDALRERELQDALGGISSSTGKIRDMRAHYADEVMAMMVMKQGGGTVEGAVAVFEAMRDGVTAFIRFANEVQLAFFEGKLD